MTPEQTAEAIIEQVFIENEVDFYFDGGAAINLIAAAIREAATVEREACAKIAGKRVCTLGARCGVTVCSTASEIAAEIRARKP